MNIIEALKTGKRLRRKSWVPHTSPQYWTKNEDNWNLLSADILADDWEIEETTIAITGSQFDAAYKRALDDYKEGLDLFADCLKRRLGL